MSVAPRGAGFEVYVRAPDGRRWRLQAKTEKQGEAMEAEIRSAVAAGREPDMATVRAISETGKKTLRQVANIVRANRWSGTKNETNTMLNLGIVLDIIGPDRAIGTIRQEDIDSLVLTLRKKGNSDPTINRKLSPLKIVLEEAAKPTRRWLEICPEIPYFKEKTGRVRFLTDAEEIRLDRTTIACGVAEYAGLWTFLIDTGARVSEALNLKWPDIVGSRVTFWETKNGDPRSVPLTKRLRALLDACEGEGRGPFPFDYQQVRHAWDRIRSHLGFTNDHEWVIHALRHTCASRLVQRGVALPVIMKWMGHKTLQVTMRYAHLAPNSLDQALVALEWPGTMVKATQPSEERTLSASVANDVTSRLGMVLPMKVE